MAFYCVDLQPFKYNALETAYLVCSLFVLLSGMVFQSGVLLEGKPGYTLFTFVVRASARG